jgi:coronin-1B/1C/6
MIQEKEAIQDFDFLPFNPNYVITGNEGGTINAWHLPDDLSTIDKPPIATLWGHKRKINLVRFNETAEGILASSSSDCSVRIWDLLQGQQSHII